MKGRLRTLRPLRELARDARGTVFTWMVASTAIIGGVMGIAIDASYLYALQSRLQTTADSAALAGASQFPDLDAVWATAKDYAGKNMAGAENGTVLVNSDIQVGTWDAASRTFTATTVSPNTVRVTVRRAAANGNPVQTFFARIMGFNTVDLAAQAIAYYVNYQCYLQGVVAGGQINFAQGSTVTGQSCVYSQTGVHFSQNATIESDAFVASDSVANITFDQGANYDSSSIVQTSIDISSATNAASRIDDLENGINLPPQITQVQVVASLPNPLTPGTAYIVNGNVSIGANFTSNDVIIAARGTLTVGKDASLQNSAGTCTGGESAMGVIATGDVTFGKESVAHGVQVMTSGNFHLSQQSSFEGAIMAAGSVQFDQAPNFTQCKDAFGSTIPASMKLVG